MNKEELRTALRAYIIKVKPIVSQAKELQDEAEELSKKIKESYPHSDEEENYSDNIFAVDLGIISSALVDLLWGYGEIEEDIEDDSLWEVHRFDEEEE